MVIFNSYVSLPEGKQWIKIIKVHEVWVYKSLPVCVESIDQSIYYKDNANN